MIKLKNNKINITKNIFRERGPKITRHKFLRLDKNERVSHLTKNFFDSLIKKISHEDLTSYPELEQLYNLLSKENKINKECFVITPGSDGGIRLCFELFVKPNDKIITLSPTFAMVDIYSKIFKAKQLKVNYDENLILDLDKIFKNLKQKVSLLILANPNSPTGTIIKDETMRKILYAAKKNKTAVLIDEAYFGFSNYTTTPLIKKFNNLIIVRTFSKSFGLAGLRAGYVVTNKFLAKQLFSLKPMYEINSLAVLIIKEFIKKKIDKQYAAQTDIGKKFLIKKFEKIGLDYFDTHANFIHVDFKNKRNKVINKLKKNKILFKGGPGVKKLKNYIRITTGPINEMKKFIKVLDNIFNQTK
tara:strand:- start:3670 stop:4746 length:1077 start_codon:yes stop_codon:yes gene_type:complete